MATIIGRNATVEVSTDGGTTYNTVGKATSNGLSVDVKLADETNNDSAGWEESKTADKSGSCDVKGKYNSANAGQAAVMAAAIAGTSLTVRMRPQTGATEFQWVFTAYVTSAKVDTSTGAVEDFSCSLKSTGAVVKSAQ
jgi:predicted secreted protein